jgi:hypothetical protein
MSSPSLAMKQSMKDGCFYYNSKAFIETGNFRDALAGNGPIFVDWNGAVRELPTAIPWQVAIRGS